MAGGKSWSACGVDPAPDPSLLIARVTEHFFFKMKLAPLQEPGQTAPAKSQDRLMLGSEQIVLFFGSITRLKKLLRDLLTTRTKIPDKCKCHQKEQSDSRVYYTGRTEHFFLSSFLMSNNNL